MTSTLLSSPSLHQPTIHQLDNGLTIIAQQMPVEAVSLNLWLNVGSSDEANEINGIAHFLEHMLFKGTPSLKMGEFERRIESRGAVTNAATSQDYTHYYITTAPKDFTELAPLQLDVVLNPTIADDAFERERSVVLEEIRRSEDNPRRRTFYRAMETAFETLPYRRQVLGPAEVIENLKPQQMRDFHRYWYQPRSVTAAVVGNLPVDQLISTVADAFEHHYSNPATGIIQRQPHPLEPAFDRIVRREYTDSSLQQARLVMMWRVPGMINLEETYALDILAAVLGQGKMSRLFRELREDRKLVTQISAANMTQKIQGVFYIMAQLPSENLEEVETAIANHITRLQTEPVAAEDLSRIRTTVANHFIFANERPSARTNLYGYYYSQLQDLTPAFDYADCIRSIEAEDLILSAQKYLDPNCYGIVMVRPKQ